MDKINLDTIAEITEVSGDLISVTRTPIVDQISRTDLEEQLMAKNEGIKSHQASIDTLTNEIAQIQSILTNATAIEEKALPIKLK